MTVHPTLPLVALIYHDSDIIHIYKIVDQKGVLGSQSALDESNITLHGCYSVASAKGSKGRVVTEARWVGELDQLLLLTC